MQRALLLVIDPELAARDLLGVPIGVRAALAAAEAGASSAGLVAAGGDFPSWASDQRARLPLSAAHDEQGERLLVRAEALVSPRLLRELPLGAALVDASGQRLAARVVLAPAEAPRAALEHASLHTWAPDRERYAIVLASADGLRAAKRVLFDGLIKPSDGPVSRHFNRHISRAVTRVCLPLGVTPNAMTVVVALTGLYAAWCASHAGFGAQVAGAVLYQLHSILDGCDGELARLTQRFGKHGALLDSLVDDLCNFLFFVGLSIGVSRSLAASWPLACACATALAYVGVIGIQYGVVLRATGRGDKTKFWAGAEPEKPTLFALVKVLLRRDAFVLIICLAVAFGLAPWAVAIFPFAAIGTLVASIQRLRGLRAPA